MIDIYADDCLLSGKKFSDGIVQLGIFDPPFGIGENKFDKHYKRDKKTIISGYVEAPENYEQWTKDWLSEAKRVLADNGSMYVFMGHTNLRQLLNAADFVGLYEINHIIWKYNFGVYTKNKYVTSHYHVLYYAKSKKSKPVFNLNCRFGSHEKTSDGGSLVYRDLEDVFVVNKEYSPKQIKNQNKLPEELIKKLIMYSSNKDDTVCDFFMGNFTTAYASLKLGRHICGYEKNKKSYDYHMPIINDLEFGCELKNMKVVENIIPANQGKKITQDEIKSICSDYISMGIGKVKKCDIMSYLQLKYGRGKFAIKNIIDKHVEEFKKSVTSKFG